MPDRAHRPVWKRVTEHATIFNTINALSLRLNKRMLVICLKKMKISCSCHRGKATRWINNGVKRSCHLKGQRRWQCAQERTLENIWQKAASPHINNTQWKAKKLMPAIHGSALREARARYYNVVYRDIHYHVKTTLFPVGSP